MLRYVLSKLPITDIPLLMSSIAQDGYCPAATVATELVRRPRGSDAATKMRSYIPTKCRKTYAEPEISTPALQYVVVVVQMGPADTCFGEEWSSRSLGCSMTNPTGTPSSFMASSAGRSALKSRMKLPSLTKPTSPISTSPNFVGSGCHRGKPYPRPTSCSA